MATFPSIYRAKAVQVGNPITAYIPAVFGDSPVRIRDVMGTAEPGMGWVFFQAGNPEFPVWVGTSISGAGGNDEVWVGPDAPPGSQELWYDTDTGTLYALVSGSWVPVSTGGGGSDEVWIGPDDPISA